MTTGFEDIADRVIDPSGGANQSRIRDYNERLVLSLVRRHGALPKSEIARRTGLSAQTASVIVRSLENDGLLLRGSPQRGKVGQPSIPMSLNPQGVYSIGIKVGRRTCEIVLVDFLGNQCNGVEIFYDYPTPEGVSQFAKSGIARFIEEIAPEQRKRLAGIGISMPFSIWNWAGAVGAPDGAMDGWRDYDLQSDLEKNFPGLQVYLQNDATAACGAELVFGHGPEFSDFVYFFVGVFIGGGIVLNHAVYSGRSGNAGALGSMLVPASDGRAEQLINRASMFDLEDRLEQAGLDTSFVWKSPNDWPDHDDIIEPWLDDCARALALAIVSCCAVIDFEATVIDGAMPAFMRERLVEKVKKELADADFRGIELPVVVPGMLGSIARAIGGASLPLYARYLLDQNVVFK